MPDPNPDDRLRVSPMDDGPFLVEGASSITRMRDGSSLDMSSPAALCRCGGSGNKPFCDGSHARNGFSDAKDPNRVPDERRSYTSSDGRITVHDNRGLCAHAGVCTDNLAAVFRLRTEPFVDPDGAPADEIAAVVGGCPSGALTVTWHDDDRSQGSAEPSIAFAPGGPYIISGGVDLIDVDLPDGPVTDHCALCRCGASTNKPFCSGKHWTVDFDQDAESDAAD